MSSSYCEVGSVESVQVVEEGSVLELITSTSCIIRLWLITDDVVRVKISFDGASEPEESYTLLTTAWKDRLDPLFPDRQTIRAIQPQPLASDGEIQVATKHLIVKIRQDPFSIQYLRSSTDQSLFSDQLGNAYVRDELGRLKHRFRIDMERDCFYGFGETAGCLNKIGRHINLSPRDAIGHDPEHASHMYKHIPLMVKTVRDGYLSSGIFYHSLRDAQFNLGAEISGYWPSFGSATLDGGATIDYFFINGQSVKEVVERYTELVGKTVLPPIWSLGYQASSMFYSELDENCDKEISAFIQSCKEEAFPVDVFNLSSGYTGSIENPQKRNVLTWNSKRFPRPERWIKRMRSDGIEVAPNVKPGLLKTHPLYQEFSQSNAFVKDYRGREAFVGRWWGGPGSFMDFTSPAGRSKWAEHIKTSLVDNGVATIWNDNNEYDTLSPSALMDGDGRPRWSGDLRNVQATLMSWVTYQTLLQTRPKTRPFVSSRGGSAGIQRYAQTWAGDNPTSWKTLRFNIATMLNLGLSGVANQGCDVGGFTGPRPSPQLLLRWVQNGIFQPRFSIHSCNNDNTLTQPWMYPQVAEDIRAAIELRYSLIPYFYSLLFESSQSGLPIMRPMFMECPEDPHSYDNFSQFFVGPFLMVANVLEPDVNTLKIHLPNRRRWIRWPRGGSVLSEGDISIPISNSTIPMFLPQGAILPLSVNKLTNLSRDVCTELEILIFPPNEKSPISRFRFYEDDGKTNENTMGIFSLTEISSEFQSPKNLLQIKIEKLYGKMDSHVKSVLMTVYSAIAPSLIELDGGKLPQFLIATQFESASSSWRYDPESCATSIKLGKGMNIDTTMSISYSRFDLVGMNP